MKSTINIEKFKPKPKYPGLYRNTGTGNIALFQHDGAAVYVYADHGNLAVTGECVSKYDLSAFDEYLSPDIVVTLRN